LINSQSTHVCTSAYVEKPKRALTLNLKFDCSNCPTNIFSPQTQNQSIPNFKTFPKFANLQNFEKRNEPMINYIIAGSSDSDETSKVTHPTKHPTLTSSLIARELLFNSQLYIPEHKSQTYHEAPKGLAQLRDRNMQNLWF
jgi:hypothetical protein